MEESMQVAMQRMAELWGSGEQPDRAAMRDAFVQMRVDMANRVSESLTPAQQREFEVLVEQFDRRMQGWDRGRRASEAIRRIRRPNRAPGCRGRRYPTACSRPSVG